MKERWFVAECRMIRGAPRYRDVVAWAANPDDAARICAVLRGGTGNNANADRFVAIPGWARP